MTEQDVSFFPDGPTGHTGEWRKSGYQPSLRTMLILSPVIGALAMGGGELARYGISIASGSAANGSDTGIIDNPAMALSRSSGTPKALPLGDGVQRAGRRTQALCDESETNIRAHGVCAASVAAPANVWLTLDLARALVNRGRLPEARKIMAAVVARAADDDQLRAGIIFADETGDAGTAAALAARLKARFVAGTAPPDSPSGSNMVWTLFHFPDSETAEATGSGPRGGTSTAEAHANAMAKPNQLARLQVLSGTEDTAIRPARSPDAMVAGITPRSGSREPVAVRGEAERATKPTKVGRDTVSQAEPSETMAVYFMNADAQSDDGQSTVQPTEGAETGAANPILINPFRSGRANAGRTADATMIINPRDPVLTSIDREMAELNDRAAPSLQAGAEFRNHSGDPGLSHLEAYSTPLQTTFSPAGVGQVKFGVTPTKLNGGLLDGGNVSNNARFGSEALSLQGLGGVTTYAGAKPADQQAFGVGLGLAYELNNFKVDAGSTPLGFRTNSVVGGMEWAPKITDHVRLRLTGERRAVDETLLSYAGTSDPRTGQIWGGVTRSGGRVQLEADIGKMNMYVAAGAAALQGTHVQSNTMHSLQAGGFFPIWGTYDQGLRTGLNLSYFEYAKNLGNFTLGQGGYFSPQNYVSAIVPFTYHQKIDEDLSYEVGVGLGVQSYRQSASDYFPIDPQLQALWASRVAGIPGLSATYFASKETGFAGSARASLDYKVAPSFQISARFDYQHVGNYQEATGMLLGRYLFNTAPQ